MTPKPLKLFRAGVYPLSCIDSAHRAANGSTQVSILIRCATKKRFAEILCAAQYGRADTRDAQRAASHLRTYCGWQEITTTHSQWNALNAVAVKPDTLYYCPDHHVKNGEFVRDWFEVKPREKQS